MSEGTTIGARAATRGAAGLRRSVRVVDHAEGVMIRIDGRELISFASNDYLGLAQHPEVIAALQRAANDWGVGSTAAHLLGGHRGPHAVLEREVADWLGYEAALLFSTGYLANLGIVAGLMEVEPRLFDRRRNTGRLRVAPLSTQRCRCGVTAT